MLSHRCFLPAVLTAAFLASSSAALAGIDVAAYDPLWFELDIGGPAKPLQAIEVYGSPNGSFAGKAVVVSDQPIASVVARVGAMAAAQAGAQPLPPACVSVDYAWPDGETGMYDKLLPTPPKGVEVLTAQKFVRGWRASAPALGKALLPIWVTFDLPADAAPGDYSGALAVTVNGSSKHSVPIKLHVSAFKLPKPEDYETFVELIESPESVAMHYSVPLWSPRHLELCGKSLDWMGRIGNRTTYVPLICRTNFGNTESMVRWAKAGAGYKYDFTPMLGYLDEVLKHDGKPQFVILHVWDTYLAGGMGSGDANDGVLSHESEDTRKGRAEHQGEGPIVTAGAAPGQNAGTITLPPHGDPASKTIWQPMLAELRAHLAERGLEDRIVLGIVTDVPPDPSVVEFFKEVLPGVEWVRRGHMRIKDVSGQPLALQFGPSYNQWAYDVEPGQHVVGWLGRKWAYPGLSVHFPRSHRNHFSRCVFREIAEANVAGSQRGFGGYGADFWPVTQGERGQRGTLSARFPETSWRNLNIETSLLAPGPDGAVRTARYQELLEGVQECEARIAIERALLDPDVSARLGAETVAECWGVLDDRIAAMKKGMEGSWAYGGGSWETKRVEFDDFINSGWQARSGKLYDTAAAVAAKLAGK